jgi:DNA adenine methylase
MRDTSIAAANSLSDSVDQLRSRVLVEIRERGGATCDEVEVALDLRHQTASARIRELTVEDKIRDSGERRLTRSGRKAVVWRESTGCCSLDPVLKWCGGKKWLLPRLRELYAQCGRPRLVELFAGSAAVALGLQPASALLRDANPHLINLYHWLQRGLVVSNIEMKNDEAHYYARRDDFNALVEAEQFDTQTGAELFYYLNRTGFNGLCRFNQSGKFNVPFGRYKKINYRSDFVEYRVAIEGWQFECKEISRGDVFLQDDFLYLDPPYDCDFVDYSSGGFMWEQQVITAEVGAAHPGPVVASNACTARILNLYQRLGYDVDVVAAPRSIAANGDRGAVLEMLATKNLTRR